MYSFELKFEIMIFELKCKDIEFFLGTNNYLF